MKVRASIAARLAREVCEEFSAYSHHCTEAEWDPADEDDWQNLIDSVTDIIAGDDNES